MKLQTIAERLKASGRSDPLVTEQVRTLFQMVTTEAERFEDMLPDQPKAVAQHGRIKDTRRSFEMVSGRLRASLELLGIQSEAE